MRQWWDRLSTRDRRVLLTGAITLFPMLFYALIWDPLHRGVESMRQGNLEQQAVMTWMQKTAQEVRALRSVARVDAAVRGNESLLSLVDRTARLGRLAGTLKRVQPDGSDKVVLSFELAPFDELAPWLEQMNRQYGIQLESAQFERQQPGLVNARITLREPS